MNQTTTSPDEGLSSMNSLPRTIPERGQILVIPFEDAGLVSELRSRYPEVKIEIIRKQDMAGMGIRALLRKIRKDRNDLVVASLYNSAANRTTSMTELMLSTCRSHRKFIRDSNGKFRNVSRTRIAFVVLPRLILGSLLGLIFLILNETLSFYTSLSLRPQERRLPHDAQGGMILFLRTDLSGEHSAGGSVSHIKGVVKGFLDLEYKVVYLADAKSTALPPEVHQVVIKPISLLDFFDEFQLIAFNIQLIMKKRSLIRRFNPDMIYQRLSMFNFAGGVIASSAKTPMILEANASEVWAKKNWGRLFFERHATRCESVALRLADKVVTISEAARDDQLAAYGLLSEQFIVNPNGVDPEEFNPSIDGSRIRMQYHLEDAFVVGFIGTFTKWHGVETLCDAAVTAIKRNPRLRFLMVGDGDLKTTLEKKVAEMKHEEYFVFAGLIPHRDAPSYLAACDILVSPHLGFTDGTKFFGSPTKLFEYMAMGKPIIASKLEQIGEIIVDSINGLWMTPGNQEELAEKILLLASDSQLRSRLGAQARKDCVEKYTWKINVNRALEAIRSPMPTGHQVSTKYGPEVTSNA